MDTVILLRLAEELLAGAGSTLGFICLWHRQDSESDSRDAWNTTWAREHQHPAWKPFSSLSLSESSARRARLNMLPSCPRVTVSQAWPAFWGSPLTHHSPLPSTWPCLSPQNHSRAFLIVGPLCVTVGLQYHCVIQTFGRGAWLASGRPEPLSPCHASCGPGTP